MYIQEPGSGSLTSYACSRCWRFSGIAVLMLLVGLVALGNEVGAAGFQVKLIL